MPKQMPSFVSPEMGETYKVILKAGPRIQNVLSRLNRRNERILQPVLQEWMDFIQKQIKRDLVEKFQKSFASELTDWEVIEKQGVTTIKPAALKIMLSGGTAAYKHLAIAGSFDVLNVRAIKAVNKFCSKLVKEITKNTKKGINAYVKHGIKQGWSMSKVARAIRPLVGLTKNQTQSVINYRKLLTAKRPDLTAAQIDKLVLKYTNKTHRRRMMNIVRTETARAQNIGYVQGLAEVGVKEAELRNGPNPCDECLALNGTKYPIDEAEGVIPIHPNCTDVMLPVINDRVISAQLKSPPAKLRKAETKVKPVDPPEEVIVLRIYPISKLSQKQAINISEELRKTYPKQFNAVNFGEMENAVLTHNYEVTRVLAIVDERIVGAISFHFDEESETIYIDHIGTLMSPKGTGAELVREVVNSASRSGVGITLESTIESKGFWRRLGFKRTEEVAYAFEADFKLVRQIKEALGPIGRVKEKAGVK